MTRNGDGAAVAQVRELLMGMLVDVDAPAPVIAEALASIVAALVWLIEAHAGHEIADSLRRDIDVMLRCPPDGRSP